MAWVVPWDLIGMLVSGDVAGLTVYTRDDGRKVWFPVAPPDKPPSEMQLHQRERFRDAQAAWGSLSYSERAALEQAAAVLSLPLTGQNLFIHVALTDDQEALSTVERQSGRVLVHPAFIP